MALLRKYGGRRPVIIVHGGAGALLDQSDAAAREEGCRHAALKAWAILRRGASALSAVEAAVMLLEDDPLFNAGTGASLNARGEVELDASIMDGSTLQAGAVAAVKGIRNPISLARHILEDGRHVLLAGDGALDFARKVRCQEVPMEALIVERQRKRWAEIQGTVGAVASDRRGHIAAATSTGGLLGKLPGRVGDSALIGAGTYADYRGGVSCTGSGEAIIRVALAKSALDMLSRDLPPQQAAERAVELLTRRTGGEGGLIIVDRKGQLGYAHSSPHMVVGYVDNAHGEAMTNS
jgi:Asparaginase